MTLAKNNALNRDSTFSKTLAYYAAFVILGLTAASLGPTILGLSENTQSQLSQISYLFSARSLGYLLGSLFIGRWYDRLPGHHVLVGALLLMAVMAFLVPLIPLLWILVVIMLFFGLGEGGLDVGNNTLLIWLYRERVGPFMNGLHFFFGLGAFLSPILIARAILISGDIVWGYWILGLLILPVALWLFRLPSPDVPHTADHSNGGQMNILLVILVALFLFLYVGAEVAYGGWIYTYAVSYLDLSGVAAAAYLTAAFWGALTVGRLLSIPIAARIRPRMILLADILGCLASLAVIWLWPGSLIAVWIGTLGIGLFMASVFPTTLTLAERRMTITGRITGWFFVGVGAGGMSVPWLVGQLFETIGPHVLVLTLVVVLLLSLGVFAALISLSSSLATVPEGN